MSGYAKAGRTPSLGAPTASALQKFFGSKRAAAVLKHAILSGYLVPFAAKVGSSSPDGRVVVVDGYAGAGRYEDGTPGSPALIAAAAQGQALQKRRVECFFVEKDRAHYERLRVVLEEESGGTTTWEALQGTVEQHLHQLLGRAAGLPLLLFLDPFGSGLSFEQITDVFKGRPAGRHVPATEVLFRFDAGHIRRNRGGLHSEADYASRQGQLKRLDRDAGGTWWRDEGAPALDGEAYTNWFMHRLLEELCRTAGCSGWTVPVKHRQELQPAYYLVFLTRHPDGMKVFAEAVSCAQDKWRRAVFDEAMDAEERQHGGPSLFDREDLFKDEERLLHDQWVEQLEDNVRCLLQDTPSFVVRHSLTEVFEGVLGVAREKHLRPALKKLHAEGVTSSDSKGDLWAKTVIRRGPHQ